MNFQDILKINPAKTKVLFCNKLIDAPDHLKELFGEITIITEKNLCSEYIKCSVDDSVKTANYDAKYSSFRKLKKLLRDKIQIKEDAGRVNIYDDEKREYIADKESDQPVIYFWISKDRIFYVGKAGNGWSNRFKQHQNGWDSKATKKRKSENKLLLKKIYPEYPTGFNHHHEFAVVTIPVNQLTIKDPAQLKALSPFENKIRSVPVDIIDELEKIFIFICQPQINTTLKNGDGVDVEILKNILGVAGD